MSHNALSSVWIGAMTITQIITLCYCDEDTIAAWLSVMISMIKDAKYLTGQLQSLSLDFS